MISKPNRMTGRMICAAALVALTSASAQIPAFPGAQGFGAYSTGGRGGDVYYVTTLNNNGAGSLREGLNTAPAAGRTIVFAVSGYIPVSSDTNFNVPSRVTIAGQTAPGDGVGLRGGRMLISGSNVVMRHFRIRHGRNGTGGDCLNIASTASSTMLDHISMMFSTDENFSFFNSSVNNFTMQYSNTAWGMERHNAGGLWDLQNGSCHHTLWAHHRTRNPKARPNGLLEWINNVTFHWRSEPFIMGDSQSPANWKANVRGCYYISIDDADEGSSVRSTGLTKARVATNGVPNFSLYLDNTLFDNNDNGLVDGTDRGYGIVAGSEFTPGDAVGANRYYKAATPFTGATGAATVTVDDPRTAYKKVISSAAPLRLDANFAGPLRDELDSLLVDSVVNQYSILVQKDGKVAGEDPNRTNNGEQLLADQYGITNNGFGTLNGTTPPTDSDLDGMPDFWEIALNGQNGMSFNVTAADNNNVFTAGQLPNTFLPPGTPVGYTYLEEYLHYRAVPHAMIARNTADAPSSQTVDLRKYTDGFPNAPAFNLTNVVNGTAQQFLADGTTPASTGPIVKFTPTLNAIGRAGFYFTVVDAEGSQWTQQFALLISAAAAPRDLVWIGDGSANAWDDSTSNWRRSSGTATTFGVGDTALFDDRGSFTPAVNITGTQTPGSMLITGTSNHAFGGSGSIASTGALTKAGSTTLTISTQIAFSAGTFLNGGETILNNGGNIAGGNIRFTGGSTLRSNHGSADANTLTLNPAIEVAAGAVGNLILSQRVNLKGALSGGGTFNIFSPSNLGTEGRVYLDGASAGSTGNVNLSGGATAPGNGGRISFRANGASFNGFGSAKLNLAGIDLFTTNNSGGNTYAIGQLSGDANARLRSNYVGGSTTWSVGGLNTSSTFAGEIMDGTALTNLTKTGSGTLTLSGANSYTGPTAVNNGALVVSGSLGNTALSIASGAKLAGNGSIAGSVNALTGSTLAGAPTVSGQTTTSSGATVSPGNTPGERAVMTAAGGLSVTSGTLVFDLSNSPAGTNDRIAVTGGSGYLAGTNAFQINMSDGVLGSGNYKLIDCAAGISFNVQGGMAMNLSVNAPSTTRQSFALQRSASGTAGGDVRLAVTGTAASLVWTGVNGNVWDLNNTVNFSGGPSGDNKFYNLDKIDFTDSASTGNVILTGDLQPRELVVGNHVLDYIFNATAGAIAGNGSLVKTGTRSLTVTASGSGNTFTGGTVLHDGTLAVSGTSPLGTGTITMNGGTLALPNAATFLSNPMVFSGSSAIRSSFSGNSTITNSTASTFSSVGQASVNLSGVNGILSLNGSMGSFSGSLIFGTGSGTLRLNSNSSGSNDVNFGSASALFDLGTGGATLNNRNGNITIHLGALAGGPNTKLRGRQTGSGSTATNYVVGALDTNTTFAGSIHSDGDLLGLNIAKVGSGTWTLSGNSNFAGSLNIDAGNLVLSGSLACTAGAAVNNTASLTLAGGTLTVNSLEIAAGASLSGSGTLAGELVNHGTITSTSGTLSITGSVVNNGTMRLMSGSQLSASGPFQNFGILDLLTASGGLPPNLENFGVVVDSSGLTVISAGIQGADFRLKIATYGGHNYQLEHSDSMAPGSWTAIGPPVVGDDTEKTFNHSGGASATKRFYRIAVNP